MTSNGSGYTRATHDVEGQNNERLEGLLGKVKILKDVGRCSEFETGATVLTSVRDVRSLMMGEVDYDGHWYRGTG